jgi:hypothetical protein
VLARTGGWAGSPDQVQQQIPIRTRPLFGGLPELPQLAIEGRAAGLESEPLQFFEQGVRPQMRVTGEALTDVVGMSVGEQARSPGQVQQVLVRVRLLIAGLLDLLQLAVEGRAAGLESEFFQFFEQGVGS